MHREQLKKQRRHWEMEQQALEAEQMEDGGTHFAMVRLSYTSLQRPLVQIQSDGISLDKVRQCEIHMQPPPRHFCKSWLSKFPSRSKRIDVISRITFPLVFALFNLVYWFTYLYSDAEKEDR
ncbi:Glutamate-gated chloride channel [Armadillidium vulgare]|nr:Glutamate-gated chloride channel [Armadillidium vulgare]